MSKFVSALVAALFAVAAVGVQAASHAGGAPMKASEAGAKKDDKKADKKEEKKEEKKK